MDDLVNVVITTYGRTQELKRAINSVVNQTYSNLKIIIIDDNVDLKLTEKVKEIVKEFNDSRLFYFKNEKNLGGALSRNEGIRRCESNYVAFLDDDDEYLENKVEKQLELLKNSSEKTALVYCYCYGIKDGKITKRYHYDLTGNCIFEGMKMCIAATSQWLCKKDYLESVGCFSNVPCKQDSTVIVKLLCRRLRNR
ncbi:MAG: glycosyltransferase family 2 protein [Clostridia bacterium]|nr:glycosyltransferase family 2 protein [Clostridia bacterium]